MKQSINQNKYENAILYFLKNCNNVSLGRTKLNKLLYYLDFISYRDRSKSVTKDLYIHKNYGPVPDQVDDILVALKGSNKIQVEQVPYKESFKTKLNALVDPNLDAFDEYEKELLERICKKFELWTTSKIVAQTHLEAPWFYSKLFDVVDYEYAKDIDFFTELEGAF